VCLTSAAYDQALHFLAYKLSLRRFDSSVHLTRAHVHCHHFQWESPHGMLQEKSYLHNDRNATIIHSSQQQLIARNLKCPKLNLQAILTQLQFLKLIFEQVALPSLLDLHRTHGDDTSACTA
jgi:hypothetical protein